MYVLPVRVNMERPPTTEDIWETLSSTNAGTVKLAGKNGLLPEDWLKFVSQVAFRLCHTEYYVNFVTPHTWIHIQPHHAPLSELAADTNCSLPPLPY